jgi:DNA-binding transcriptional LysR family regulator
MNDPLISARMRRLQQLRLRDLRLLDAIEAHGTLQAVARALFVTQPAVSQALRSLEEAVGVPLAVRSRRGVVLTDPGRTMRVHLQAAHATLAAGLARLDAAPARPLLRLGTIPYALVDAMPAALARLGDAPFSLRIVSGAVDALMRALLDGTVDAVVTRRARVGDRDTGPAVHATQITTIRNAIACGRDHRLARRVPVLAALAREDWVLPGDGAVVRKALDALFAQAGLEPPRVRVESGNFSDNLRIAAAARLLTVAPVDVIERARPAMRVLLEPPGWQSEVMLMCLADRADWPPLAALRAALVPPHERRTRPLRPIHRSTM